MQQTDKAAQMPREGHVLRQVFLGPAPVVVECRSEEQEFASGRVETFWIVEHACINGTWVPYSNDVYELFDMWSEQLGNAAKADAAAVAESLAMDAYRERCERMGWAA